MEDLLKELYLEAERSNQPLILNIHKRMFKKSKWLKDLVIETNAGVSLMVKEFLQAEINGDLYAKNGITNEFVKSSDVFEASPDARPSEMMPR